MSFLFGKIARYIAHKAATDPETRDKAIRAARIVVEEARQIAKEDDRARAAGRALRRALKGKPSNR